MSIPERIPSYLFKKEGLFASKIYEPIIFLNIYYTIIYFYRAIFSHCVYYNQVVFIHLDGFNSSLVEYTKLFKYKEGIHCMNE